VRHAAAAALGQIGDARAVDGLLACLAAKKEDQQVRHAAAAALGQIGDARAVDGLLACLAAKKEDQQVRHAAAAALGQIGGKKPIAALRRLLDHRDLDERTLGLAGLSQTCKDPLDRALLPYRFLDPKAPVTEERIEEAARWLGLSQEEVRQRYELLAKQFGL
jgi:HEAT repeat protein